MTVMSPRAMHFRRPNGIPMNITQTDITVEASVYAEAIIGIVYAPVGCYPTRQVKVQRQDHDVAAHAYCPEKGFGRLDAAQYSCIIPIHAERLHHDQPQSLKILFIPLPMRNSTLQYSTSSYP